MLDSPSGSHCPMHVFTNEARGSKLVEHTQYVVLWYVGCGKVFLEGSKG